MAAFKAHQADIAFVCGIFSLFTFGISGVIAIVLGVRARKEIAADPEKGGAGTALSAIVLGAVGCAAILALFIAGAVSAV